MRFSRSLPKADSPGARRPSPNARPTPPPQAATHRQSPPCAERLDAQASTDGEEADGEDEAGGDGERLAQLFRAHHLSLVRMALLLVGDRPTAEDIVQDVYARLYRLGTDRSSAGESDTSEADGGRGTEHVDGLGRPAGDGTARRSTAGRRGTGRRGRGRLPESSPELLAYTRAAVLNACRTLLRRRALTHRLFQRPQPVWSAEKDVLLADDRRRVLRALTRLPSRQREAIVLRYYLDLSEAEIAAAMGVRPGTVKSTISRGLDALRDRYEEER